MLDFVCFISDGQRGGVHIKFNGKVVYDPRKHNHNVTEEMSDIREAKKLGKALFYNVNDKKIYTNEKCTKPMLSLEGKRVLVRPSIIASEKDLMDAVTKLNGINVCTIEDRDKIEHWPDYFQPLHREVKITTLKESKDYILNKLGNNWVLFHNMEVLLSALYKDKAKLKSMIKVFGALIKADNRSEIIWNMIIGSKTKELADKNMEDDIAALVDISKIKFPKHRLGKVKVEEAKKEAEDKNNLKKHIEFLKKWEKDEVNKTGFITVAAFLGSLIESKDSELKCDNLDVLKYSKQVFFKKLKEIQEIIKQAVEQKEELKLEQVFIKSMEKRFSDVIIGIKPSNTQQILKTGGTAGLSKIIPTLDMRTKEMRHFVKKMKEDEPIYRLIYKFREDKMFEQMVEWEHFVKESDPILISPVVKICRRSVSKVAKKGIKTLDKYREEYRCYIIDGEFYGISLYDDKGDNLMYGVPQDIVDYAKNFLKKSKEINFPQTYVLDIGRMEVNGKTVVDIIEVNPIFRAGRYSNNSLFHPHILPVPNLSISDPKV